MENHLFNTETPTRENNNSRGSRCFTAGTIRWFGGTLMWSHSEWNKSEILHAEWAIHTHTRPLGLTVPACCITSSPFLFWFPPVQTHSLYPRGHCVGVLLVTWWFLCAVLLVLWYKSSVPAFFIAVLFHCFIKTQIRWVQLIWSQDESSKAQFPTYGLNPGPQTLKFYFILGVNLVVCGNLLKGFCRWTRRITNSCLRDSVCRWLQLSVSLCWLLCRSAHLHLNCFIHIND